MSKVKLLDLFEKSKNPVIDIIFPDDEYEVVEFDPTTNNYYGKVIFNELRSTDEVWSHVVGWRELRFCINPKLLDSKNLSGKVFASLVADLHSKKEIHSLEFRRKINLLATTSYRILNSYEKLKKTDYIYITSGKVVQSVLNWGSFKKNNFENRQIYKINSFFAESKIFLRRVKVI